MAESQWRVRSRQVIARVMASVPADATLPQVRRLLREAYPFGERAMHPYKMWCIEQRIALNTWRGKVAAKGSIKSLERARTTAAVRMRFLRFSEPSPLTGQPWLDVVCSWCDGSIAGGCMVCVQCHNTMIEALHHPERKALAMAQRAGDKLAGKLLADWYRDHIPGLIEEVDK